MTEITGAAFGLIMTAVGVAVGGLMLQVTLLMLGRAMRGISLVETFEPLPINVS